MNLEFKFKNYEIEIKNRKSKNVIQSKKLGSKIFVSKNFFDMYNKTHLEYSTEPTVLFIKLNFQGYQNILILSSHFCSFIKLSVFNLVLFCGYLAPGIFQRHI